TPIVDDPYWFGQIAAANALSDVYAMGGVPKTAMNLVCFPLKKMDLSILRQILQGGLDKMKEADVVLVGGHSVEDNELKYGLSVTGFIHPNRILTKKAMEPGDQLILTKALGTGIINTAIKGGIASKETIESITHLMAALNRDAAEVMGHYPVHACTDITGFGLLGHMCEMVVDTDVGIKLQAGLVPYFPEAMEYAQMGLVPAGTYKNREFREAFVDFAPSVDGFMQDILFDAQTSGGLLISVARERTNELLSELKRRGMASATVIGEVVSEPKEKILVE
ncbi:MAG: selenide, water dikinase SelD, partial [Deltaproteobacteria bacterium]|nr:selenide, water dikinase SelD [Deltaproteobacteria bacterium]